ncbi:hypothetical protein [Mycobacterium sp. GA-2829]|uniref:hypothetical protein n=1 Tax=Mycobacterium sp. GA-2829 TaxID=1772283 RepID=UPI000A6D5696|nr:hypothetical protein [Mycobacterium sp. GA-2829]
MTGTGAAESAELRIVVLIDDPRRTLAIVPGCRLDSLRPDGDTYFFEDGDELVGL